MTAVTIVDRPAGEIAAACRAAAAGTVALALGVLPFGIAIGATAASTGVSPVVALSGAFWLMAGAAQLAALELTADGAGVLAAAGTAILINVRFVLYSAGLQRWFADLPRRQRLALAVPLVDQTFLLGERTFGPDTDSRWRRAYYLTATSMLFGCFAGGQVIGYFLGSGLPPGIGLHLAAPLAFAGLLALSVEDRPALISAGAATIVVVAAAPLPGGLALPLAAVAGLAAGTRAERRGDR